MPAVLLRRVLLLIALPLALARCGESERPNIVLIILDTARADRFPFDGYARPTAPNLQALAKEGAVVAVEGTALVTGLLNPVPPPKGGIRRRG